MRLVEITKVRLFKPLAFNNRLALKDSFGKDYNKLFPGSIFNPPSYSENFLSSLSEGYHNLYLPPPVNISLEKIY